MKAILKTLSVAMGLVLLMPGISGRAQVYADSSIQLDKYLVPVTTPTATPDAQGFLGRWLLLEPISKPNRSNTVFIDSYIREVFAVEYFKGQLGNELPKDGDKIKVTVEYQPPVNLQGGRPMGFGMEPPKYEQKKVTLKWHAMDSKLPNVKLFRFATNLTEDRYGVIFWTVTVINCEEDIENVRLAVGSNKAARWWVNGEEVLLLAGDRHMGVDSAVSDRVTLKKGRNVLRGVTMNGPGMSEFCARFIDDTGKPVTGYTITCN